MIGGRGSPYAGQPQGGGGDAGVRRRRRVDQGLGDKQMTCRGRCQIAVMAVGGTVSAPSSLHEEQEDERRGEEKRGEGCGGESRVHCV
eukprot:749899-Hanusia_phi.AAC.1